MALQGYGKFENNSLPVTVGNVNYVNDKDLPTAGQPDATATAASNTDYPFSKGWFRVYWFEWFAGANVELGAGVSVGNITDAAVKIMKLTGENTAIAQRANYNRAMFDFRLVLSNRAGNEQNKKEIEILFKGAVFRRITSSTGDIQRGSQATSASTAENDTREIDTYEMVFQAADIDTYKKKTTVSAQGKTK